MLVEATNQQSSNLTSTNSNALIILALIIMAALAAGVVAIYMLKGIFIMSPRDKIKLELAKKPVPDIFTRYTYNFFDNDIRQDKKAKKEPDIFSNFNISNQFNNTQSNPQAQHQTQSKPPIAKSSASVSKMKR